MVSSSRVGVALVIAFVQFSSLPASAQVVPTTDGGSRPLIPATPDTSTARMRVGPLLIDPALAVRNIGVDTNVFNEPTDANPKSDFTAVIAPAADFWLPTGRAWLTGSIREEAIWFQKYSSERSSNFGTSLGVVAPLSRVGFAASGDWRNTRERPGYEIDTRANRREDLYTGVVELRAFAKTLIGARATRLAVDYDDEVEYEGSNLARELNRDVNTVMFTVRNEITPLTSLSLEVGRAEERYEFASYRDADATDFMLGLHFDPDAILNGWARFGVRRYDPHDAALPVFTGFTTAVDVSYVAAGSTKLTVGAQRNVEQSFEITQPYYVLTGLTLSVDQQIYGPVDAVGRFGAQRLAYRDRGVLVDQAARIDNVRSFGGGGGYRLGADLRIGVDIDHYRRISVIEGRRYSGLRVGASVTYGQ